MWKEKKCQNAKQGLHQSTGSKMDGGRKRRQEQAVKMRRVCQEAVGWGEWKGEREEEGGGGWKGEGAVGRGGIRATLAAITDLSGAWEQKGCGESSRMPGDAVIHPHTGQISPAHLLCARPCAGGWGLLGILAVNSLDTCELLDVWGSI